MNAEPPSPSTTLVIILGASKWPLFSGFEASEVFTNSASGIQNYFLDPYKFGLPTENLLNLFDSDQSSDDIDDSIGQFLKKRVSEMKESGNPAKDVFIYFTGHGGFAGSDFDYYLAIRRTRKANPIVSSVRMLSLAHTIRENTRHLRHILILDCCFAAAAFNVFQQGSGPEQTAIAKTVEAFKDQNKGAGFPSKGTSLLCSSSRNNPSIALYSESYTVFSGALLQVLSAGSMSGQRYLSLRSITDLVTSAIQEKYIDDVPRPEVHSPDQSDGDVANVPIFPNLIEDSKQLSRAMIAALKSTDLSERKRSTRLQNLRNITVAIMDDAEQIIVGTGTVISPNGKIITCTYVIEDLAELGKERPNIADIKYVKVRFSAIAGREAMVYRAAVVAYLPANADDIVMLQVIDKSNLFIDEFAVLGNAEASIGHDFRCYGYRHLRPYSTSYAMGTIMGEVDPPTGAKLLKDPVQLWSEQLGPGMSGAPILDVERNLVVGFLHTVSHKRGPNEYGPTAWAVNAHTLSFSPFDLLVQDSIDLE